VKFNFGDSEKRKTSVAPPCHAPRTTD